MLCSHLWRYYLITEYTESIQKKTINTTKKDYAKLKIFKDIINKTHVMRFDLFMRHLPELILQHQVSSKFPIKVLPLV